MFVASLFGAMLLGAGAAEVELRLQDSEGRPVAVRLSGEKPVVLFYEDRDGGKLNRELKDELFRRAKERGLLGAARLVAIANVRAYDWFPAKQFALGGIRDAERQFDIRVWADFRGVGAGPPYELPERGAAVLLLDREGGVAFRATGSLSAEERARFFETLERLLSA